MRAPADDNVTLGPKQLLRGEADLPLYGTRAAVPRRISLGRLSSVICLSDSPNPNSDSETSVEGQPNQIDSLLMLTKLRPPPPIHLMYFPSRGPTQENFYPAHRMFG